MCTRTRTISTVHAIRRRTASTPSIPSRSAEPDAAGAPWACMGKPCSIASPKGAAAGPGGGLCVLLGEHGTLAADLAKRSEWTVFVQVAEAAQARPLRQALDTAGLLGNRVAVQHGNLSRLHLADDLADAVIVPGNLKV